jgi:ornithine carbamoyltransferase
MASTLKGRSLLTLKDFSAAEIREVLDLSHRVKKQRRRGKITQRFRGKALALLFEKRSTRTRCAFETAFGEEGGIPVFLSTTDIHLGSKEPIEDTARILGSMYDAIQFRGFKQETVEILARCSGVPVYNGLTDDWHPTQVLADLLTVEEVFGGLAGKKIAYMGDGRNNVANTLLVGCARMGVHISIVAPRELFPAGQHVDYAKEEGGKTGAKVLVTADPAEGLAGADAVYTDVWISMGEEEKSAERIRLLAPYRVTSDAMKKTGKDFSIFLHCLPAVRGNEVTADVLDGQRSLAWEQGENRKHTIKALMLATI